MHLSLNTQPTSLAVFPQTCWRMKQIKATVRHHVTRVEGLLPKWQKILVVGAQIIAAIVASSTEVPQQHRGPCYPAVPPVGTCPRERKQPVQEAPALLTTAKKWEQTQCPPTDERIKKRWRCKHTWNSIRPRLGMKACGSAATCMEVQVIMWSEGSQAQKSVPRALTRTNADLVKVERNMVVLREWKSNAGRKGYERLLNRYQITIRKE